MMDENFGRFEVFEVTPPAYDPFPEKDSHLRKQVRITGDTVLLRGPGMELNATDRKTGCHWYQKNIRNATMPANIYASTLLCSLYEIDETRRIVDHMYQQCVKFSSDGVPRIFGLLGGSDEKSAIIELYSFLCNLRHHLQLLEKCTPGFNSGTPLISIVAEDPLSRIKHCLAGKMLIILSETILCTKCPYIAPHNMHLIIEFGDDLLRIAFLLLRFTYDIHPAIGSAILKYADRLGCDKTRASHVSYDEYRMSSGPYVPYFRIGQRTDADIIRNQLFRLQTCLDNEIKYTVERVIDLIDVGAIVSANAIIFQQLVFLNALVGLWFCKQFKAKERLGSIPLTSEPEKIEELAQEVYRYQDKGCSNVRSHQFHEVRLMLKQAKSVVSNLLINTTRYPVEIRGSNSNKVADYRKRATNFLARAYDQLLQVVIDPSKFAENDEGPFDKFCEEQDAYLNKIVYQRLCIGCPQPELPLLSYELHYDQGRLTTKSPDTDQLLSLQHWPSASSMDSEA